MTAVLRKDYITVFTDFITMAVTLGVVTVMFVQLPAISFFEHGAAEISINQPFVEKHSHSVKDLAVDIRMLWYGFYFYAHMLGKGRDIGLLLILYG
jgi:hypothetical protein